MTLSPFSFRMVETFILSSLGLAYGGRLADSTLFSIMSQMKKIANAPDYSLETELGAPGVTIAGVDEVGRGAWAGPVVAAAVILDAEKIPAGVCDSKQLTKASRESLFEQLCKSCIFAVGIIEREEIDRSNILKASLEAMQVAIGSLAKLPQALLIDGKQTPPLPASMASMASMDSVPMHPIVKGDSKSLSIAAASIVAKVTRDRIMTELSREHPEYGWERNAGYGTVAHREALERFGVSGQHRRSFAPIHKILSL